MLRRTAIVFALALLTLTGAALAAPPPDCDCDFCIPNPTAKCRLPGGGQTTCGVFMRSGICLGQLTATETATETAATPAPATAETAAGSACKPATGLSLFVPQLPEPFAAACCIDQCRRDRDCDALCGAKGAGACIAVNSCCKECACAF